MWHRRGRRWNRLYVWKKFEDELGPISLSGEAGVNAWIEVEIDIEHGEIECGITARTEEGAKASVECSQVIRKS